MKVHLLVNLKILGVYFILACRLMKNVKKKVCCVCSRKAYRCSSAKQILLIKTYVDKDYNERNPDYPMGICNGCMLLLNKKENGCETPLTIVQSYKFDTTNFLRISGPTCQCTICKIAHSSRTQIRLQRKNEEDRSPPPMMYHSPARTSNFAHTV